MKRHASTLPVLSKQDARDLLMRIKHYFFSYSHTLVVLSLAQETNVELQGFKSMCVIESVCPMNEHSILLSCSDQYIIRSKSEFYKRYLKILTVIVSLTGGQNALIMVGKLDQVDAIALAIVSVNFLSAFKVV